MPRIFVRTNRHLTFPLASILHDCEHSWNTTNALGQDNWFDNWFTSDLVFYLKIRRNILYVLKCVGCWLRCHLWSEKVLCVHFLSLFLFHVGDVATGILYLWFLSLMVLYCLLYKFFNHVPLCIVLASLLCYSVDSLMNFFFTEVAVVTCHLLTLGARFVKSASWVGLLVSTLHLHGWLCSRSQIGRLCVWSHPLTVSVLVLLTRTSVNSVGWLLLPSLANFVVHSSCLCFVISTWSCTHCWSSYMVGCVLVST